MNDLRSTARYGLPALLLALALTAAPAVEADDRELVKGGTRDPYLHVIFDVSGSMNWQPPDDNAVPAVPGDAWAPGYGDDPNSKMYQAKSALYTVISDPTLRGVLWGFSTYNQDYLRVHRKHYIYTPRTDPPWVTDGRVPYPAHGQPKHFGDMCMDDEDGNITCDLDDGQDEVSGQLDYPRLGSCGEPQDFDTDATIDEDEGETFSFPVLGDLGTIETVEWVRFAGRRFQLHWSEIAGGFGAETIDVQVSIRECGTCSGANSCSAWLGAAETTTITFERVYESDRGERDLPGANEVLFWQQDTSEDQAGNPAGFFGSPGSSQIRDMKASGTCEGWEPNSDSSQDLSKGVRLKYVTQDDPLGRHSSVLDRGDVIPLDWKGKEAWGVSNRDAILQRLSPNFDPDDPAFEPEFRNAPYFRDSPDTLFNGRLALKPEFGNRDLEFAWGQFESTPPLIPQGATPIGNSMRDFLSWYDTWKPEACDSTDGDAFFGCRSVNLLILTDGDETCYGGDTDGPTQDGGGDYNPCRVATQLLDEGDRDIRTFVIGFGVRSTCEVTTTQFCSTDDDCPSGEQCRRNFLNCIAENGGTESIDLTDPPDGEPEITGPILPGNEQELVDALRQVVQVITTGARSFSSAAVPQGQVDVQDKVYLTSFLPDRELPIWPARVDAYLKPIPLVEVDIELPDGSLEERNVPNPARGCGPALESACHLWNAGEQLLLQAAADSELVLGNYNLGPSDDQRRVYYGVGDDSDSLPMTRRFFMPPDVPATEDDDWQYLLEAFDICAPDDTVCGLDTDNRDEGTEAMEFTHRQKVGDVPDDDPRNEPMPGPYILGDIFHSDPRVLGGPDNFTYWVADVGGNGSLPLDDYCDTEDGSPDGYRCYFAKQRNRRKLLLAGANDGQVHAFDAGNFRATCDLNTDTSEQFVVGEFDNGTGKEVFSYVPRAVMPTLDDLKDTYRQQFTVDGRVSSGDVYIDPQHTGTPDEEQREWRTVIMGGLREGGSGYYLLDVTHPDVLTTCDGTPTIPSTLGGSGGYVPSCLNGCAAGDGGSDFPYPMPLFEFYDNEDCGATLPDGRCDDDLNGRPDLADSWSTASIGRIKVLVREVGGLVEEDRYVAIFGGGLDVERKDQLVAGGNFLFMVDIETGKAIYKRELEDPNPLDDGTLQRGAGSAAADAAAVDTDQDGYLDTIYVGTTRGYMFKADISQPAELVDLGSLGSKVIDPPGCETAPSLPECWAPFPIFDTGDRPIYFPPAVVFVALRGQYALAFGTGDREDLWSLETQEGRLYMILDNNFELDDFLTEDLPKTESDYAPLGGIDAEVESVGGDLLRQPPFGWFLKLDGRERVITRSFTLGGVTVFSSFQPSETISEEGSICLRRGSSRVFVVNTTNADALLEDDSRYFVIEGGFLSAPFVETGTTTNPDKPCTGPECNPTDAVVPDNLEEIKDELRALLPPQCRFANYTINIKAVRDDTGIEFLAAIPVCTVRQNWKDF